MAIYNVQCLRGHVEEVSEGDELWERCRERAAEGILGALVIDSSECPGCQEEARRGQIDFRGADLDFLEIFR